MVGLSPPATAISALQVVAGREWGGLQLGAPGLEQPEA